MPAPACGVQPVGSGAMRGPGALVPEQEGVEKRVTMKVLGLVQVMASKGVEGPPEREGVHPLWLIFVESGGAGQEEEAKLLCRM